MLEREDIIKFAQEADLICESRPVIAWIESTDLTPYLTRFAALVAAAEREACAKVCEDDFGNGALNLADAIRARGNS